jgi:hypothetical protein
LWYNSFYINKGETMEIQFVYNDGGREEAGYKGYTGDCVTRAIAIAAELPYKQVYDFLANGNATQRKSKHTKKSHMKKTARNGVFVRRKWFQDYMKSLGFRWVSVMGIGTGCTTHVRADELPSEGRIVLALSKHYSAYVNGVLMDTYDCSREGTRCVYGYFIKE